MDLQRLGPSRTEGDVEAQSSPSRRSPMWLRAGKRNKALDPANRRRRLLPRVILSLTDYNHPVLDSPDQIHDDPSATSLFIGGVHAMSDHRIRFRGGWEFSRPGTEPDRIRNFRLPVIWTLEQSGTIRLTRHFGQPPIDPQTESAWLEFERVPDLQKADLNGFDLGPIPSDIIDWSLPIDGLLQPRNLLTLDLIARSTVMREEGEAWGSIALVIKPRDRSPGSK